MFRSVTFTSKSGNNTYTHNIYSIGLEVTKTQCMPKRYYVTLLGFVNDGSTIQVEVSEDTYKDLLEFMTR